MNGNLGLHVIEPKPGVFVFVGTLPAALATWVPATTAAVMAGRAVTAPNGAVVEPTWPTFTTAEAAVAFAAAAGFTAKVSGAAAKKPVWRKS